ncbi:MAG: TAT-variant-translocated molybdopterin oxidoreductase [Fibrobacteres bacterium]|nr:TAT-variant-translocated molybdopterin oxidoreductase [Fibrobacterota bacterium]
MNAAPGNAGDNADGPLPGSARREGYFPRGKEPWTSLEEFAKTPGIDDAMHAEYPPPAGAADGWSRRSFLRLMGASLALAGVTGCGRGVGLPKGRSRLLPYVRAPEGLVPGRPRYYATTLLAAGDIVGVLGETHMGRPTKLEGNPDHPASLGATDLFAQAAVLDVYDPARSRTALEHGLPRESLAFRDFLLERRAALLPRKGEGLRLLTGEIHSPSLLSQITALLAEMPAARWHVFDPVGTANSRRGAELAFGRPLRAVPHLDQADVVVCMGADPFGWGPERARMMHDWAARRALREIPSGGKGMSRWYAAESHPSPSGNAADHRLQAAPSRLPFLLRCLSAGIGTGGAEQAGIVPDAGNAPQAAGFPEAGLSREERAWIEAAASDLRSAGGRGLVLVGESLPPESHLQAHFLNGRLGNSGNTLTYVEPMEGESGSGDLASLAADMQAGKVDTLIIMDANPAYAAPPETGWSEAVAKVPHSACVSYYLDETSAGCAWHAPMAHGLESWGDARAWDGTLSLQQPLIEPLAPAWTPATVVAALRGDANPDAQALVREYWQSRLGADFETRWRETLRKGVLPQDTSAAAAPTAAVMPGPVAAAEGNAQDASGLEIEFRPDPTLWDGRYAFNPWLQETPKPFTNVSWGNAAYLSPATAKALGLASRDEVELRFRDRSVLAPVWILPGQCDGVATVHLGHGRAWPGPRQWLEGTGSLPAPEDDKREAFGFNAYSLRSGDALWYGKGLEIRKTGRILRVACRQGQDGLEGRPIVRAADLSRLREDPGFCDEPERESLYPLRPYAGHAWGMTIDMSLCTGCSACVVACRAENNVPVVGKEGVLRHRDMAWLRIDRYFIGPSDKPAAYFQPMLCQHCEQAPCEVVCPVEATVHDGEGLNQMIYNRCIGTRYCSNNCPYKVRRFNFFDYARAQDKAAAPQRNPDVTVRGRGVMEKCTFCVQRIAQARIASEKESRPIRDGEAMTACMQACPTGAIVFGDLNDGSSRVAILRKVPWKFAVLGELNARPRIRYLAKIWNQHPALPADTAKSMV